MAKAAPAQVSFNGGEWSPLLQARTDLSKYGAALSECLNFVPTIQGPLIRRSGTRFVREVKDSSKTTRLLEFEFNDEQAYVIEAGDNYMRFHRNHGTVLSSGTPYEISTIYDDIDLFNIQYDQSNDVMTLCDGTHAPQKLSRFADTNWSIASEDFDPPPFQQLNTTNSQLTASDVTGSITVTASSGTPFQAGHVDSTWKIEELVAAKHDEWTNNESVSTNDLRRYEGRVYRATTTGTTGNRALVHKKGTESDGAVSWEYLHSGVGYFKITAFNSATSVNATVTSRLPDSATSGTLDWTEPRWSGVKGYPVASTYFQGRHYFAKEQTLDGSFVGDFPNFALELEEGIVTDDSAVSFTLDSNKANIIRWMTESDKGLVVGTIGGEWIVRANEIGDAITPTNVKADKSTSHGTARIRPVVVDKATLFAQRAKQKLIELVYSFQEDGFLAPDMTELSEHITRAADGVGIVDIAYQRQPYSIIWCVRADGALLGFTYNRQQDVLGWHQHIIGGWSDAAQTVPAKVESIAVIPSPDGTQEDLWMVVNRYIDGGTKRYIEYLEKFYDADTMDREDIYFVDSGLTYDGAAASTISGLDHLEGETVQVIVDGATHPDRIVNSGQITLDAAASVVHIGFSYTSRIKTLNFEAGATDGTAQGKTKRFHLVGFDFLNSLGGFYGGERFAANDYVEFVSQSGVPMDQAPPLETGIQQVRWPEGYEKGGKIVLEQRQPLPMTLRAILPQMRTYDP